MSDNAFGLAEDPQEGKTDPFADEPQAGDVTEQGTLEEVETEEDVALDQTPAPEEVGEPSPEAEVEEAEAEEAEPEEDVPEVETVEETEERLYAGKYKSPEELERGYSELSTLQREAAAKNAELTEYLRVAAQVIQENQQAAQTPPEPDDQQLAQLAEQYGTDVETIRVARAMAQEQTEQAVTPLQAQMQQQAEERQQYEAYMQQLMKNRQMVAEFKSTVDLDDATEHQMVEVFEELQLDETDPEMYPVAYEAAQNPALREKLQAWPDLVTTEAGMREARRLALTEGEPTQKRSRNTAATRQRAHVEAGGTGAAPEATEKTEKPWDVLELARKDRAEESVFGV